MGENGSYTQLMCAASVSIVYNNEVAKYAGYGRFEKVMNGALSYQLSVNGAVSAEGFSADELITVLTSGQPLQWMAEDATNGFTLSGKVLPSMIEVSGPADQFKLFDMNAHGNGGIYVITGVDDRGYLLYADYSKVLLEDNSKIRVDG